MEPKYGGEGSIKLAWGGELRFPSYDTSSFCDYVRIVDDLGRELAYWNEDEWQEDAGYVMGAIMGFAQHGPAKGFIPNYQYWENR